MSGFSALPADCPPCAAGELAALDEADEPRLSAAIERDGAEVTSVSSATLMSEPGVCAESTLRAADSNQGGISLSPPPWRAKGTPVRTSSGAALGARRTA